MIYPLEGGKVSEKNVKVLKTMSRLFSSLAQETLIIRIIVYLVSSRCLSPKKAKILINVGKVQEQANF